MRLLRRVVVVLLSVLVAGACNEQQRATYPTFADAERAKAAERGWIPQYVPRSATEIAEVHDLDVNTQRLRFRAPLADLRSMVAALRPVQTSEVREHDDQVPELKGPWPNELRTLGQKAVRDRPELGLFFAADEEGARCVAVEWKARVAYAWSCDLRGSAPHRE